MGKKKRVRKLTVFGCVEGDREKCFLDFLREIYQPDANNIALYPELSAGGTPDRIVTSALQKCDRDKSFAWFDEDFEPNYPLSREVRESLAIYWNIPNGQKTEFYKCPLKDLQNRYNKDNRKPVLVVSQPICVESLILQVLGKSLPYPSYKHIERDSQIAGLKNKIKDILAGRDETVFYRENLSREKLEKLKETLPELNLLIQMLTK